MIAYRLIEVARAAGLSLEIEGDNLFVEADRDPPPELIAALRQHKHELMKVLGANVSEVVTLAADTVELSPDRVDEPAALVELETDLPKRWTQGRATLSTMRPPAGFHPERWERIAEAAGTFIDRWAATAAECGWSDLDLFGCNPDRPDARFDAMGLAMLLDRCEVIAVDEDGATLRTESGSELRFYRRELPANTVPLWQLINQGIG